MSPSDHDALQTTQEGARAEDHVHDRPEQRDHTAEVARAAGDQAEQQAAEREGQRAEHEPGARRPAEVPRPAFAHGQPDQFGGARADRVPFAVLLLVPVVLALLVIDLPRVLLAVGVVYALSGPVLALWQRMRPAGAA